MQARIDDSVVACIVSHVLAMRDDHGRKFEEDSGTLLSLALVCKAFHPIAIAALYRDPYLEQGIMAFASALSRDPALALHMRSFHVDACGYYTKFTIPRSGDQDRRTANAFRDIVKASKNLARLCLNGVDRFTYSFTDYGYDPTLELLCAMFGDDTSSAGRSETRSPTQHTRIYFEGSDRPHKAVVERLSAGRTPLPAESVTSKILPRNRDIDTQESPHLPLCDLPIVLYLAKFYLDEHDVRQLARLSSNVVELHTADVEIVPGSTLPHLPWPRLDTLSTDTLELPGVPCLSLCHLRLTKFTEETAAELYTWLSEPGACNIKRITFEELHCERIAQDPYYLEGHIKAQEEAKKVEALCQERGIEVQPSFKSAFRSLYSIWLLPEF